MKNKFKYFFFFIKTKMPLYLGQNRLITCSNNKSNAVPIPPPIPPPPPGTSGPVGAVQLSSGPGATLTHNPDIYVSTETVGAGEQINRLVLDSTIPTSFGEPDTRLRFIQPAPSQTGSSALPLDGDIAYFNDGTSSGLDLRLFKGTTWVSLTTATGAPSVAAQPNKAIQFCAPTGTVNPSLNASPNFTFDTTITPNVLTVGDATTSANTTFAGNLNITTSSNTTIAQFDTANGIQMQTTAGASGIDIKGLSAAPINLQTATGALSLTSTSAGISLNATTAGQTITNITGNIVTELKDDSASGGEFLTMSSNYTGNPTRPFGLRLRNEATYDLGVGASLYLDGTNGINTPRQATLE